MQPASSGLVHYLTADFYRKIKLASAEKSIAAKFFNRNFGYAAAAIMAALSVDSGRDGKYTGSPSFAASRSKVCRSS